MYSADHDHIKTEKNIHRKMNLFSSFSNKRKAQSNNSYFCLFLAGFLFGSCAGPKQLKQQVSFTIINPTAIERADELVVLSRSQIEEKIGELKNSDSLQFLAFATEPLLVQFDDMNSDGAWDEAAFLYKFEPNQKLKLTVVKGKPSVHDAMARAHVRMRKQETANSFGTLLNSVSVGPATLPTDFSKQKLPLYLTEGPAWENDKVAFRQYLDTRNIKDIYGKTTPKMMMDTVGSVPANSYHVLSDWGMDILAVGKSLGAGSLAVLLKQNEKDTLVRLGGNNIERTLYSKVADGPIRAIFRMKYTNWKLSEDVSVNATEEISIWGGKYYYDNKVTIDNAPATAALVAGLVNLKNAESHQFKQGQTRVLYTYADQSENKDKLGLAMLVPAKKLLRFSKTVNTQSDVLNTYTAEMPIAGEALYYRFVAGWERSSLLFSHQESFEKYLVNEAIKYSKPLKIR